MHQINITDVINNMLQQANLMYIAEDRLKWFLS